MNIKTEIESKLTKEFSPNHLKVENESHMHSGSEHSQTHFRIEIVAEKFKELSKLNRHRKINKILELEFSQIKACSVHAFTKEEWEQRNKSATASPRCHGG